MYEVHLVFGTTYTWFWNEVHLVHVYAVHLDFALR